MTNRRTLLKTLAAGSVALPASKIFAGDMRSDKNKLYIKIVALLRIVVEKFSNSSSAGAIVVRPCLDCKKFQPDE